MSAASAGTGLQFQQTSTAPPAVRRFVRFGPFHLDRQQQELFKDGSRVKVQGKVCEALLIMINQPGELVTRETLRARLWPTDTQINYDANVNTTVNKLRQVLGDSPERPTFVETVPRKGYTFIADVEAVQQVDFVDLGKAADSSEVISESSLPGFVRTFLAGSASLWFTAGVVALLIAGMLFGAAIVLYAHRGV